MVGRVGSRGRVESLPVFGPEDVGLGLAVNGARQFRVVSLGDGYQVQLHFDFRLIYHHLFQQIIWSGTKKKKKS